MKTNFDLETKINLMLEKLIDGGIELTKSLVLSLIVFYLGKYVIKFFCKFLKKTMEHRSVEITISKFVLNIVSVSLKVALFVLIIGILGVKTSSILSLIAATGFGIGLALSGTMQNFANGILLLVFKPYRVGDYIDVNGVGGTVKAIQIFHTILTTIDNKTVYVPNGTMGSATMTNFSQETTRRLDWNIGVDYGEDFEKVKKVLLELIDLEPNILKNPAPIIEINKLADSSVQILLRCWTYSSDYWDVFFSVNKKIYTMFNQNEINFPFPQLTIHQSKK